ncbi:Protein kinase, catalytic domain-containing protein [Rozella allomycis CSF55]|uniref:Serine/threonine-protein kinase n=1 Tax=Rozella allomycis (strain CSF55) TaxID=988480 RepID=A0A075AP15_ROZAC|nr:Protein kinase, catalytic domain-containing protein [Rozella allomycis CSF55]|eukprot:EPZ31732.1 Protein kinase, catalytic domain-containing protein [Rozella allomycis CSF55]
MTVPSTSHSAKPPSRPSLVPKKAEKPQLPSVPLHLVDKRDNDIQYIRGPLLGEGGFARCYYVTCCTSQKAFAAKAVPKIGLRSKKAKDKLLSEIKLHRELIHENIVKFIRAFEDDNFVYIILELCENKTCVELLKEKKRLSEPEAKMFFPQILGALQCMHDARIIHRDLKLGNLFIAKDGEIKIGDFGLATKVNDKGERKKTICGTPNYIAPEILFNNDVGHSYEVDIWSLGVILYTMLIGKPPFQTKHIKEIYEKIKNTDYTFPDDCPISAEAKDLIEKLLSQNPKDRPTIMQILEHPFMRMRERIAALTDITNTTKCKENIHKEFQKLNIKDQKGPLKDNDNYRAKAKPQIQQIPLNLQNAKNDINYNLLAQQDTPKKVTSPKRTTSLVDSVHKCIKVVLRGNCEYLPSFKELKLPDAFITKWIDYTMKYGFVYSLSNGIEGMLFNDHTTLLLHSPTNRMHYFDLDNYKRCSFDASTKNEERDLEKKKGVLLAMKGYMSNNLNHAANITINCAEKFPSIYLTKYMKADGATLFRLSNRSIQVNFQDHTKLVFSNEGLIVTFIDSQRNLSVLNIKDIVLNNHIQIIEKLERVLKIFDDLQSK